jgi:tRNA (mo5U34)-methyltransferase
MSFATSSRPLEERIRELGTWFHRMHLGGVDTAPDHFLGDYPRVKFQSFGHVLPQDLSGQSVLDIGCNAGFYSLEMKRRGAARVVGIDSDDRYLAQGRLAAEVEGVDIEFRNLSVYEVGALGEKFDLVIFMGVFYHLRHPLLALDLIHQHVSRDLLLFQSMQRGSAKILEVAEDYRFDYTTEDGAFDEEGYPRMSFIEHKYAGDPTNWWVPNASGSMAMLRSAGYEILHHPEKEVFLCRHLPAGHDAPKIA